MSLHPPKGRHVCSYAHTFGVDLLPGLFCLVCLVKNSEKSDGWSALDVTKT